MNNKSVVFPPELRGRWYLQVEKYGKSVSEVCVMFGISRKTYYKWYKRDHPLGKTGRRPKRMHPHTKIQGNIQVFIVEQKTRYNYGPKKMSVVIMKETGIYISPHAVYRLYKRKKLIRKPQKQLKWYCPMKEPFYAEFPGQNVQLDVKYVPGPDVTWEYQYRFIDQKTNIQFSTTMLCKDSRTTISAFRQAQRYFPFAITGIQTDNGGEFRGHFHEYLIRKRIVQRYIPKRSAPWNGKVERANRSVDDEYYLNPTRPWKTVFEYTQWYNHERPHLGKEMYGMTPHEKYLSLVTKV